MRIEEEIKQVKPFKSPHQKAAVNLMYTHGWLLEHMRNFFLPFGITVKQFNILRILNGAGQPISTSTIRERLIDKMSDTTRIINRMIDKELVEKKECKSDKRLVDITISSKGKKVLKQVDSKSADLDKMLKHLSSKESKQLNDLLDKMRG